MLTTDTAILTNDGHEIVDALNENITKKEYFQVLCTNILNCIHTPQKQINQLKSLFYDKILNDPIIIAKYAKKNPILNPHVDLEMKSVLKKEFLKKVLTFIHFLDVAKSKNILPLPRLLKKESTMKSSKEVLIVICKELVQAESNIINHLSILNYIVTFEQTFTDEFDYTINNLTSDLKDGVRLAKFIDIVTYNNKHQNLVPDITDMDLIESNDSDDSNNITHICQELRVPAVSRLQKIHNILLSLQALQSLHLDNNSNGYQVNSSVNTTSAGRGMNSILEMTMNNMTSIMPRTNTSKEEILLQNEAKKIVDGDTNATLLLLWRIMYSFNLKQMVTCNQVVSEINRFVSYSVLPIYFHNMITSGNEDLSEINRLYQAIRHKDTTQHTDVNDYLLLWLNVINGIYQSQLTDHPILDFSTSLADGSVLCFLIHYYHPKLLPLKQIYSFSGFEKYDIKNTEKQQRNFITLRRVCKIIGGIPLLSQNYDFQNPPDSNTMEFFLIYLFTRLMLSSVQVNAAIKIQNIFKLKYEKQLKSLSKNKNKHPKRSRNENDVPVTISVSKHLSAKTIQDVFRHHNKSRRGSVEILDTVVEDSHNDSFDIESFITTSNNNNVITTNTTTDDNENNDTMVNKISQQEDNVTVPVTIEEVEVCPEVLLSVPLTPIRSVLTPKPVNNINNNNTLTSGTKNFQFIPKRHTFVPKRVKVAISDEVFSPEYDKENMHSNTKTLGHNNNNQNKEVNNLDISKIVTVASNSNNMSNMSTSTHSGLSLSPTKPLSITMTDESCPAIAPVEPLVIGHAMINNGYVQPSTVVHQYQPMGKYDVLYTSALYYNYLYHYN